MDNLKLVSLINEFGVKRNTEIRLNNLSIGKDFLVIAGPCSLESQEQIMLIAKAVKKAGANMIRGGVFKPRTSPYSFRGLGRIGLEFLFRAGKDNGLPVVTEVVDTRDVEVVSEYADILQIGTRNMQNFSLLVEVGKANRPVLLKRGMNATIEEWLNSAEYIMNAGNPNVILCERGIRTIETYTKNTLDISAVPVIKRLSHLPIIVDPSHATGRAELVHSMALSSIMAGCDGLEIEVHPSPKDALSDKSQQINPEQFGRLMDDIKDTLILREKLYAKRQEII